MRTDEYFWKFKKCKCRTSSTLLLQQWGGGGGGGGGCNQKKPKTAANFKLVFSCSFLFLVQGISKALKSMYKTGSLFPKTVRIKNLQL